VVARLDIAGNEYVVTAGSALAESVESGRYPISEVWRNRCEPVLGCRHMSMDPARYSEHLEKPANGHIGRPTITFSYVIIGLCILAVYFVAQREIYNTDQTIVPRGDAFSYSTFLFEILNKSQESFFTALDYIASSGNFIWLQHVLVLVFSPFLFNQRGSLIFINYFGFFICAIVVFRTAILCKVGELWAFAITLVLAAMPWNFNAEMPFNLTSLMPEPLLVDSMLCSMLLFCWLLIDPLSKRLEIAIGFALGTTIWSRGNAFMYLAMPAAAAGLVFVFRLIWPKWRLDVRHMTSFAIAGLVCVSMAAIYFYFTHHAIYNYYFGEAASVLFDYHRKIAGSEWILINVPGLAIAGKWFLPITDGSPYYSIALTLCAHVIVLYSIITGARKIASEDNGQALIAALGLLGGATFYFYMLFACLTFSPYFSDPLGRELHPFEPALVGFMCCVLSVLCGVAPRQAMPRLHRSLVYAAATGLFLLASLGVTTASFRAIRDRNAWSAFDLSKYVFAQNDAWAKVTPCDQLNVFDETFLDPKDMERLSLRLSEETSDKFVFFFWYDVFNASIMNYYTAQNGIDAPRQLPMRSDTDRYFLVNSFQPEKLTPESSFRVYLKYVFANADLVVIPEQLDGFTRMWDSAIVEFRQDIADAVNSPEIAPDYGVWAIVDDLRTRVLILQRRSRGKPDDGLTAFPRTWGTSAQVIGRDFPGAYLVRKKPTWQSSATSLPQLLYAYGDYNLVRVGQFYVAAAHDLGPLNINDILTNKAPRPVASKFIVTRNIASLKAAVDACTQEVQKR
jgi:hypothetical protein